MQRNEVIARAPGARGAAGDAGPRDEVGLAVRWTIATAVALAANVPLGLLLHRVVPLTPGGAPGLLFSGALYGALLGAAQGVVLRRALLDVSTRAWVGTTAAGFAAGLLVANIGPIQSLLQELSVSMDLAPMFLRGVISGLVLGGLVGCAQGLVLARAARGSLALSWVVASCAGVALSGGAYALVAEAAARSDLLHEAVTTLERATVLITLIELVSGLVAGLVGGLALIRVRRLRRAAGAGTPAFEPMRPGLAAIGRAVRRWWQPVIDEDDPDGHAAPSGESALGA